MSDSISDATKTSWLHDEIVAPAQRSLEVAGNAGINLLNAALSPTGKQLDKWQIDVSQQDGLQTAVSGLVSALPYAVMGSGVGCVLRFIPGSGMMRSVLNHQATGQMLGAALLDGWRDTNAGETVRGNVAGSLAAFGTYEALNPRLGGRSFVRSIPLRLAIGMLGGTAQALAADLASFKAPDLSKTFHDATAGGAMNLALPTLQYALARTLHLRPGMPAKIDAEAGGTAPARESSLHNIGVPDDHGLHEVRRALATDTVADTDVSSEATPKVEPPQVVKHQPPVISEAPAKTEAAVKVEEAPRGEPRTEPKPPIELAEYPAFALLQSYAASKRALIHKAVKSSSDHFVSSTETNMLKMLGEAQSNIGLLASGKLTPDLKEYMARGWLNPDFIQQLQGRLRDDLDAAYWPGFDRTNLEDLAVYRPSDAHRTEMERLAGIYSGSMARVILRATGKVPPGLDALYVTQANAVDADMNQLVAAVERTIINPATRDAAMTDLDIEYPILEQVRSRYLGIQRAETRAPGPVELTGYRTWESLYKFLGTLEDKEANSGTMSLPWAQRSARHIDQIATGEMPEHLRQRFAEKPDVLNQMRSRLERDLSIDYLSNIDASQHKVFSNLAYGYRKLLEIYQFSPTHRLLESTGDAPPALADVYKYASNIHVYDRQATDSALKGIDVMERLLLDPETAPAVRSDISTHTYSGQIGMSKLVALYAPRYEQVIGEEPGPLRDYSSVVQFRPRRGGGAAN